MRDKSSSNLRLIWSNGAKAMSETIAAEVRTICRIDPKTGSPS